MSVEKTGPFCSGCERDRSSDQGVIDVPHPVCPRCGSITLTHAIKIQTSVKVRVSLGLKMREPGKRKAVVEAKYGADLRRDDNKWLELEQVVDRKNNYYKKKLTDPETGEVLRDDGGKLTDHQGFGDAKKKL